MSTEVAPLSAPRDDLIRMAPSVELRAGDDDSGRTLVGYAAMFNEDTTINSWEGQFVERIAPGAFKRTLRNNGDQIKVLFNHGMDPSIGDKPLGRAKTMKEDKVGLFVEVPMSRTSYNDDLIELLNDGAIDGMSFRFSVVKEQWEEPTRKGDLPIRTIQEARLYELGPVTFPAYAATSAGVRGRTAFNEWHSASRDLGTSDPEPGSDATSETEPAATTTDDSSVPLTRSAFTSLPRRRAALIERGITA